MVVANNGTTEMRISATYGSDILTLQKDPKMAGEIDGKVIAVTGATGSYGKRLLWTLLLNFNPRKIIIFSRDELKQSNMQIEFKDYDNKLRYFIGCIRDYERLTDAFQGVDVIFHAAALKQVVAMEYNPFEAIKTNVVGANNVIRAAVHCGVKKVVALSTDKAASPMNLYGATKLCQDKLMVAANHMYQGRIQIGVVRYGNVFGSRGSVVPFFAKQRESGTLTVTDERMTRFTITLDEGVAFSLNCLRLMQGGEILIPKIASYKILTVAEALAPTADVKITGIRPGEKLHEVMVPVDESPNTLEYNDFYIIYPSGDWWKPTKEHHQALGAKQVEYGFEYSSGNNNQWVNAQYFVDNMHYIEGTTQDTGRVSKEMSEESATEASSSK